MAKPALVIDMLAAPASESDDEATSSPDDAAREPTSRIADNPEDTIASIRSQLDQLEAALRGLT